MVFVLMDKEFNKVSRLKGELNLPGDKSISHRSVIFSALAKGKSTITNCSNGEDVKSTINCFKKLGCEITFEKDKIIVDRKSVV